MDNSYSDEVSVTSGVPQGKVLGQFCFLYMSMIYLPDKMKCEVRMYTNDVALYTDVKSNEKNHFTLQADLHELSRQKLEDVN